MEIEQKALVIHWNSVLVSRYQDSKKHGFKNKTSWLGQRWRLVNQMLKDGEIIKFKLSLKTSGSILLYVPLIK